MICLFDSDLSQCGGIIDTETSNPHFLRMVRVLEKMGVKNRYFFLHLTQPELQGIDPHNLKDSSTELKMRIMYESKVNPWYFLREVIRVPSAGGDPIRYILNRANLALNWLFFNSADFFLVMPRQCGKTMGIACLNGWAIDFGYRNTTIGLFAKDTDLVHENVSQIKSITEGLPKWMIYKSPADTDNKEGLSYAQLNNTYKTFVARPDPISAKKMGRGERLAIIHFDEFAFFKHNDLSYAGVISASDKAQAQVRESGLPACNIITTTAGRLSEPAGAYAYSIKQGCVRFSEKFYDFKDRDELRKTIRSSESHMAYLEFSYKQLGFDDAWLADKMVNKTTEQVEMDYLNHWLAGTGQSIIPQAIIDRIVASERDPVEFTQSGQLIINWYIERKIIEEKDNKRKNYIIGMDTSDNIGRDYTTMVVVDPSDLTVVCTCKCNVANFIHVVNCVVELMVDIFPNSIIIPERNKNGAVLIDILIEVLQKRSINPFYRIYNTFIQDYNESTPSLDRIDLGDGTNRRHFGFNTSASADSRDTLYGRVLINMLNHMANRLFDKDLADEIKSVTVRNGRIDHPAGCHDDLCIALLLCGYFAFYGRNHYMYGIPNGEVLKSAAADGRTIDPEEKVRQLAIRNRIGTLKGLLMNTKNTMVKASYERELRILESQIDNGVLAENIVSVNQMQNSDGSPAEAGFKNLNTYRQYWF